MVAQLLGLEGHHRHEAEGLDEVVELELAVQRAVGDAPPRDVRQPLLGLVVGEACHAPILPLIDRRVRCRQRRSCDARIGSGAGHGGWPAEGKMTIDTASSSTCWPARSAPTTCWPATAINDDYTHDEALTVDAAAARSPWCCPPRTDEVAAVLRLADEHGVPVTARGAGTGLSGACVPARRRHRRVVRAHEPRSLEIDTENHVAVVQPGVHARPARRGTRPPRARLPGVPGRVQRQPRRQRRHQRRRHAGGEVRRHPPPRARPRGRARRRARSSAPAASS